MKMKPIVVFVRHCCIAMALLYGGAAQSRDLHVAPTGTPDGDGSVAHPLDIETALGAKSPAQPGDTILLAGGVYEGKMNGITRTPFALAVSGAEGKPIKVMPEPGQAAQLDGTTLLTSSYTEYIGLEIGDNLWDPWQKKHMNDVALNASGGTGAKVINCNIFGGAMGTGAWTPAVNLEIYGCLIHDFGYLEATGRGHGHAFYAQNKDGTKLFSNNIAYRGCGWNVHIYTQGGSIEGFDVIDNICYLAGAVKPGQTMDNYLVGGYPAADRIRLIGNVGYQPDHSQPTRPDMRLSSFKTPLDGTGTCQNNYLMGAGIGLTAIPWKGMKIEGNTIWGYRMDMDLNRVTADAIGTSFVVDGNTYIADGNPTPFRVAGQTLDFAGWQALGLDKAGQFLPGKDGKPTGTKVFVYPNQYEKGRGNVGVFDWDGLDKVAVDLSRVLNPGQRYAIYNCLDITQTIAAAKPVLTGTYAGGSLELPMRKDPISPDFDAFLVKPL